MKRVTRNIDLVYARDLLERVPRACISFACDDGPHVQPIVLVWHDDRYFVGIAENADCRPATGQEVVILIDEGIHFFGTASLDGGSFSLFSKPLDHPSQPCLSFLIKEASQAPHFKQRGFF